MNGNIKNIININGLVDFFTVGRIYSVTRYIFSNSSWEIHVTTKYIFPTQNRPRRLKRKLAFHIIHAVPLNNLFKIHFDLQKNTDAEAYILKLQDPAIFSNFLPLKKALSELEAGKTVIIDLSEGFLIDHTVMEFLHDFSHDYEASGGHCEQQGAPIIPFSGHALAARIMAGRPLQ